MRKVSVFSDVAFDDGVLGLGDALLAVFVERDDFVDELAHDFLVPSRPLHHLLFVDQVLLKHLVAQLLGQLAP